MKKLAIRSLVLLAWSMNLASCTSDDVRENNSVTPDAKGLIPVEIRSGINGGRTELNNDGKTVVFQANDSLAVWDGQGDQEIRRFGTKDGGSVAIFKGSLDENASNLNILYPLQDGATCNSGTITATIPATQKATAGTFDPRANLSVATADYVKGQNVTCTLENVCGVLKFTVPGGKTYTKVEITGANGTEDIAGNVTINPTETTPKATAATGAEKKITLTGSIEGGKNYYVALIPQEFTKGIKMDFYTSAAGSYEEAGTATVAKTGADPKFEVKPGEILNAGEVKPVVKYVEIAGLLWATCNLGADTEIGYGDYYQWGSVNTLYESISWSGTTATFTWKSGKGSGFVDANKEYTGNDATLPDAYDVVKQKKGEGWRIPAKDDFQALYDACTSEWQTNYNGSGINGRLFTDKTDPSKKLFFPAAGYGDGTGVTNASAYGCYWSSTINSSTHAHNLFFNSGDVSPASGYHGREYGLTIRPVKTKPITPIGNFTVNDSGGKVSFAPGNLQAKWNGSKYEWAFAANQYDYVGNNAGNTTIDSQSVGAIVDLFGWTKKGLYDDGIKQYGINTSTMADDYGNDTNAPCCDWGATIDDKGTWKTLTSDEWGYLLSHRTGISTIGSTSNARFARVIVNLVNGLLIFPDAITWPFGITAPTNINATVSSSFSPSYTVDEFGELESLGCVFLPCAGIRIGSAVNAAGNGGYYWSSSPHSNASNAYSVYFNSGTVSPQENGSRSRGRAVRLVCVSE